MSRAASPRATSSRAASPRTARPRSAGRHSPSLPQQAQSAFANYLKRSERPLTSLCFVLPMIVVYEVGWRFAGSRLLAFNLLHQFFSMLGAPGTFLPALALIGILLTWHILSRDKWVVHIGTLAGMFVESILLALPLLALATALERWQWHLPLAGLQPGNLDRAIIAMGAGIYEELIFRLIALVLLHTLLVDILRIPHKRAVLLMVLISALAFSFYHYLGTEQFAWKTCLFRTAAGIYFAGIFMCRGFGVTAGCHAVYDMIIWGLVASA